MAQREGNLQAPTRHPLDWQSDDFYNEDSLNKELERVFDICHGCRRCVSLCDAFPTMFDLVVIVNQMPKLFAPAGIPKPKITRTLICLRKVQKKFGAAGHTQRKC